MPFYLCDCYNQFTWSSLFSLNWPICSFSNVITVYFDMICLTGFVSRSFVSYSDSYLVSYLCGLTLSPTVTTSYCGCLFLFEFSIYNAKYLCYFQFYVTGFSGCMPYLLTWAGKYTYKRLVTLSLTWVCSSSLSLFTWALTICLHVLFTWTFITL